MIHVLLTVVIAHFLALLSPGPDFLLIVKSAVRNSRFNALGVALGIASANALYICLCLIGVGAIIAKSIYLMAAMRCLGGLFLTYLAYKTLLAKKADYDSLLEQGMEADGVKKESMLREFATGFLSAILNPKNPIFYLSLFSVVLNDSVGLPVKIGLGVWMSSLVFFWDAFIIYVLSGSSVRKTFAKSTYYVDKLAGTILGFLGIHLVRSAVLQTR